MSDGDSSRGGGEPDADASSASSFDAEEVMVHVDGDRELLREIVDLFSEDSPKLLDRVSEAIAERDAQRLWNSAHALKGAIGNFAATRSFELAERLETLGREADFAQARAAFDELHREIARLHDDLVAFLK